MAVRKWVKSAQPLRQNGGKRADIAFALPWNVSSVRGAMGATVRREKKRYVRVIGSRECVPLVVWAGVECTINRVRSDGAPASGLYIRAPRS